jgi:Ricin-type beta-trefoil lectin domain-like
VTGKLLKTVSILCMLIALDGCGGGGGGSAAATPAQAVLQWAAPSAISYGTALSGTQLDATSSTQGTFAYSPGSGTVLTAGTHTLTATFTPAGSGGASTVTTTITVNKATPTITWATPAAVSAGTALGSAQLNASASVAGTFAYSPAAGTTMSAAGNQALSVTFTPTDSADYASAQDTVTLVVKATGTAASVSIDVSSVMGSVPSLGYGVDSSVYDGYMTNPGLGASLKAGGFNAIRYPGGSYADIFNFISGSDQTLNDGGYFAPGDTFNNWISDLIQPSGAKGVITVNYGSNQSNDGPAPASEAASWVQYADITNDYGILYWEIGNEIYGNGYYASGNWEYDLHDLDQTTSDRVGNAALSPTAYGTNAAAFIEAMKAVDPNIKCGVFVSTSPWVPNWDQDVLGAISSALQGSGYTLDFVILHWYPSGTDAQVLASPATIGSQVSQVRSDIQKYYTLGNAGQLQLLVTETAATSDGGIFPYLFTTDEFLTWFEQGASNVEYQELNNGVYQSSSSNTPIGPWYGVSFDSTVARPGDRMVSASSSNSLLRVHGVRRSDGQVGVVLINDDPANDTTVSVSVSGATLASTGTEYTFGNADFASGSQTPSHDISSSSIGGVGNDFTVTVPAYSTVAVLIPESSTSTTNLIANGNYVISNSQTGLVLDDYQSSKTAGTFMDMAPENGGSSQTWTLANLGNNYVELVNVNSGLALDVYQGSTSSGAQIDQQPWSDSGNQIWEVVSMGNGNYELLSQHSGLSLGVPAATSGSGSSALLNGTGLDQETVTGAADQLWSFYN